MVLGIPNVGKSAFINKAAGRKAAAVSDKPGVTRGKQWITVDAQLELLDTPGVLAPRIEDKDAGELLAITCAVKAEVFDMEALASNFLVRLRALAPGAIEERYKFFPEPGMSGFELLQAAAGKRGFLVPGGERDTERMAAVLLDEFRDGRLGRITLESP